MPERLALLRRRFWFEAALATATGLLFVVTLFWHDWLELLGLDPDRGDGSAEWLIVAVLGVVCATFTLAARGEWRKAAMDSA